MSPCASAAGTARTASVCGEKGEISSPSRRSVSAPVSALAISAGVAGKVAGISSGWLCRPAPSLASNCDLSFS